MGPKQGESAAVSYDDRTAGVANGTWRTRLHDQNGASTRMSDASLRNRPTTSRSSSSGSCHGGNSQIQLLHDDMTNISMSPGFNRGESLKRNYASADISSGTSSVDSSSASSGNVSLASSPGAVLFYPDSGCGLKEVTIPDEMHMQDLENNDRCNFCKARGVSPTEPDNIEMPSLDDVLNNQTQSPFSLTEFMAYLSQNHCLESLEFCMDTQRYIELYKSVHSGFAGSRMVISTDQREYERLIILWERIVDSYIRPNSPQELNLPYNVRDELLDLTKCRMPPSPDSLEHGLRVVKDLMNESLFIGFLFESRKEYMQTIMRYCTCSALTPNGASHLAGQDLTNGVNGMSQLSGHHEAKGNSFNKFNINRSYSVGKHDLIPTSQTTLGLNGQSSGSSSSSGKKWRFPSLHYGHQRRYSFTGGHISSGTGSPNSSSRPDSSDNSASTNYITPPLDAQRRRNSAYVIGLTPGAGSSGSASVTSSPGNTDYFGLSYDDVDEDQVSIYPSPRTPPDSSDTMQQVTSQRHDQGQHEIIGTDNHDLSKNESNMASAAPVKVWRRMSKKFKWRG
ncbi:hypothetical protein V1511DRAFT_487755 [Dipodascopsis uninucleata]